MIKNTLESQSQTDLNLYQLYLLQDYLNVMQQNLNLLLAGSNGKIISTTNDNLFALAVNYYNDATLWTEIAQANFNNIKDENGFITPIINGIKNLIIPPKPATLSGGVLIV